jgi:hypothetical protein
MIKRCLINYYSWVITVQHIYNNMFISGMHAYCTQLVHLIVQMLMINLCTLFALIGNEYSLTMNSMTMIGIEDKILLQYNKMQTPKVWIYDAPVWVIHVIIETVVILDLEIIQDFDDRVNVASLYIILASLQYRETILTWKVKEVSSIFVSQIITAQLIINSAIRLPPFERLMLEPWMLLPLILSAGTSSLPLVEC